QLAASQHVAEERLLRELAHPDGVLEHASRSADLRLLRGSGNRDDIEVDLRGEASVQAQFLLAIESPRRQRREIEKAKVHRFLDLVGMTSGQQYVRDVRLQRPDGLDAVQCRLAEGANEFRLSCRRQIVVHDALADRIAGAQTQATESPR